MTALIAAYEKLVAPLASAWSAASARRCRATSARPAKRALGQVDRRRPARCDARTADGGAQIALMNPGGCAPPLGMPADGQRALRGPVRGAAVLQQPGHDDAERRADPACCSSSNGSTSRGRGCCRCRAASATAGTRSRPVGQRVVPGSVTPRRPADRCREATYRVTVNSFLAERRRQLHGLKQGRHRATYRRDGHRCARELCVRRARRTRQARRRNGSAS